MAVDKAELLALAGHDGDDGTIAGRGLEVWEAMLGGKWTVNKEREKAAQARFLGDFRHRSSARSEMLALNPENIYHRRFNQRSQQGRLLSVFNVPMVRS